MTTPPGSPTRCCFADSRWTLTWSAERNDGSDAPLETGRVAGGVVSSAARAARAVFGALALTLLTGCPTTGIVCRAGTDRCGTGCADYSSDRRNCGGCGIGCAEGQECVAAGATGACTCRAGTTACGSTCAVLSYDTRNCGQCGTSCTADQVCESGQCKASCSAGTHVKCGSSCVSTATDPANCGECGRSCNSGQSCRAGSCTYDLLAACYSTGQLAGLRTGQEARGALTALGSGPAALATWNTTLLAADGLDRRLYQADLLGAATGGSEYAQLSRSNRTGGVPNQVLVDPPFVYVINAESGTLQVLERGADAGSDVVLSDAGLPVGGVELATVAELNLGPNTWPEGMVKLGNALWIPLYGGYGAGSAAAGQKVLRVSVAVPQYPSVTETVDLSVLDLRPFDGGSPVARPWAVTIHQGAVYVALNNLNPDTYAPEGPGLLARIDPTSKQASVVGLGDECLNPQWLASSGPRLVVSCGGEAVYSPTYALLATRKAGLVVLDESDAKVGGWAPSCPADAGTSCPPMMPGRFAFTGGRVYLGDQNAGRVFVLDVTDAGVGERRGYAGDAGAPLQVCPPAAVTGIANVAEVVALP